VVIANAGIAGPHDALTGKFTTTPPSITELKDHLWSSSQSELNAALNVNVTGSYVTFLAFLTLLDAGNKHEDSVGKAGYNPSQFITTGSIAGLIRGNIVGHPYSASMYSIAI
jgi:NAD(P)-dependent dehydrogenase (short-subunit alcohol dehydrogenase family)